MKKVTLLLLVVIAAVAYAFAMGSVFAIRDHRAADAGLAAAKGIVALGVQGALASGGTPTKLRIFAKHFSRHWTFLLIAVAEFLDAGFFLINWKYDNTTLPAYQEILANYASEVSILTLAVWIIVGLSFAAASYRTITEFKKLKD